MDDSLDRTDEDPPDLMDDPLERRVREANGEKNDFPDFSDFPDFPDFPDCALLNDPPEWMEDVLLLTLWYDDAIDGVYDDAIDGVYPDLMDDPPDLMDDPPDLMDDPPDRTDDPPDLMDDPPDRMDDPPDRAKCAICFSKFGCCSNVMSCGVRSSPRNSFWWAAQ